MTPPEPPRDPATPYEQRATSTDSLLQRTARAFRAEAIRLGGASPWWRWCVPAALLLPLGITFGIGAMAERIQRQRGLLSVEPMHTNNACFWVASLGVVLFMLGSAWVQAKASTGILGRAITANGGLTIGALLIRWCLLGLAAAASTWLNCTLILGCMGTVFPAGYGEVALFSSDGARLLWALPVWAFAACGIGLGVAEILGSAPASMTVLAVWAFFAEDAIAALPFGDAVLNWLPMLNGVYGAGQMIGIAPSWGPNGALAYVLGLAAILVVCGFSVQRWRVKRW